MQAADLLGIRPGEPKFRDQGPLDGPRFSPPNLSSQHV
jgi:hypothetical protein